MLMTVRWKTKSTIFLFQKISIPTRKAFLTTAFQESYVTFKLVLDVENSHSVRWPKPYRFLVWLYVRHNSAIVIYWTISWNFITRFFVVYVSNLSWTGRFWQQQITYLPNLSLYVAGYLMPYVIQRHLWEGIFCVCRSNFISLEIEINIRKPNFKLTI